MDNSFNYIKKIEDKYDSFYKRINTISNKFKSPSLYSDDSINYNRQRFNYEFDNTKRDQRNNLLNKQNEISQCDFNSLPHEKNKFSSEQNKNKPCGLDQEF